MTHGGRVVPGSGKTKMRIKVATHNVCHSGFNPATGGEMTKGAYRFGYPEEWIDKMRENWKNVYSGFSADLIGLQEYCEWFDLNHTEKTADVVFKPFGYEVNDGKMGTAMRLAVASKHPLELVSETDFAPVSERRRQKFYVTIGGKRIAVFNCHPTPKPDGGEVRLEEYRVLIEDFRKEECFIAFGDYNARTAAEFEIFEQAGFPMANHGIPTVRVSGSTCDNIVVSPNIRIVNLQVHDPAFSLSDHAVLYAELEVE